MNIFITSLLFLTISACNIIKDKSDDTVGANKLVSSSSVQLMRVFNGTQLNFSLKATRPIDCEIFYWENSETTGGELSTDEKKHPCQTEEHYKTIISTNINGLDPNKKYRFRVQSWTEDAKTIVEKTNVVEKSENSFSITDKNSYIIKNQLNKNTGGVFSYNPTTQISFASLETGCQTTLSEPEVSANPLYANSVNLSGFTNGEGRNLQLPNPFVQFPITSKNYDLPLSVSISDSLGTKSLRFSAPLAFQSIEASSINKISVPSYREGDTPPSIRSSNGDSLNLTWTKKGQASTGYLNVYVDDLAGSRLLTCRYDANDGSVSINNQTITSLKEGSYRISLELKSFGTDQNSNSLVISSDWRVLLLKRS